MSFIAWMHNGVLPREEVGGKGASLSDLMSAGFKVPDGFCVTAEAYRHYVKTTGIEARVAPILASLGDADAAAIRHAGETVSGFVRETPLPDDLRAEIVQAHAELSKTLGSHFAVRSSAISEDGSAASFAGLYESYLNMVGEDEVLDAVHRC